jgi:hypothetical protein
MEEKQVDLSSESMVISFNEFYPSYIDQPHSEDYIEGFDRLAFEYNVNQKKSLIYTDGEFKVWR